MSDAISNVVAKLDILTQSMNGMANLLNSLINQIKIMSLDEKPSMRLLTEEVAGAAKGVLFPIQKTTLRRAVESVTSSGTITEHEVALGGVRQQDSKMTSLNHKDATDNNIGGTRIEVSISYHYSFQRKYI